MKKDNLTPQNFQCYCGKYIPDETFGQYQGKDKIRLEVCDDLPFYREKDGNQYCILHCPIDEKDDIDKIIKQRLDNKKYNFGGVWFPKKANFHQYKFEKDITARFDYTHFSKKADFWHAEFPEKVFFDFAAFEQEALFSFAEFEIASFHNVTFSNEAIFYNTRFRELALFTSSYFKKHATFGYSKFKNASFSDSKFSDEQNEKLNFFDAEFKGFAIFSNVTFPHSLNFSNSIFFDIAAFNSSEFNKTYFNSVEFKKDVFFSYSTFQNEVSFEKTKFRNNVDFSKTKILNQVQFIGDSYNKVFSTNQIVSFDDGFIEKPERFFFHAVVLCPNWFVNVDARKFVFQDVDWKNANGTLNNAKKELEALQKQEITGRPQRLLAITCRQLADNAENNNHYEQASNFRRMAMELVFLEKSLALRLWLIYPIILFNIRGETKLRYKKRAEKVYERWEQKQKKTISFGQSIDPLHYLYRWLSCYGESWRRAFVVLFIILATSTWLYTTSFCVFKDEIQGFDVWEAISYSLRVMALQRPEPQPANVFAKIIVAFETILAPLQLALLALAIRRKFMR